MKFSEFNLKNLKFIFPASHRKFVLVLLQIIMAFLALQKGKKEYNML